MKKLILVLVLSLSIVGTYFVINPLFSYFYIEFHLSYVLKSTNNNISRNEIKATSLLREVPSELKDCEYIPKCKSFRYESIISPFVHFCVGYDEKDKMIWYIPCHE